MTDVDRLFKDMYTSIAGEVILLRKFDEDHACAKWSELATLWAMATDNEAFREQALVEAQKLYSERARAMSLLGRFNAEMRDRAILDRLSCARTTLSAGVPR